MDYRANLGKHSNPFRCEQCGGQNKIEPARSHGQQRRSFLLMVYRDRNKHPGLADDAAGRTFLTILLSLGLPIEDVFNLAPWLTETDELRKIMAAAKRFDPTPENIGKQIAFTDAERKWYGDQHHQYSIRSSESDWNVENEQRIEANKTNRNEARKAKRQAEKAALIATCRHPMEVKVVEAMLREDRRPGAVHDRTVKKIISDVARHLPQMGTELLRRAVHHALDHLKQRGVVKTEVEGRPGKQTRTAVFIPNNRSGTVRTVNQAKTSADQCVKPGRSVAQAEVYACATKSGSASGTSKRSAEGEPAAATAPDPRAPRPVVLVQPDEGEPGQALSATSAEVCNWHVGDAVGTPLIRFRHRRRDGGDPQLAVAFTVADMVRWTEARAS